MIANLPARGIDTAQAINQTQRINQNCLVRFTTGPEAVFAFAAYPQQSLVYVSAVPRGLGNMRHRYWGVPFQAARTEASRSENPSQTQVTIADWMASVKFSHRRL